MARISTYQQDSNIQPQDKWIGSDAEGDVTKNFTVSKLVEYLQSEAILDTFNKDHSELDLNDGTNPHGTTKEDLGLSKVNNTSDLEKPISTATQSALDQKASLTHTHVKSDITDFNESDYATSAQGDLADTSLQPEDDISQLSNNQGYLTSESDPIFSASEASNFVTGDKSNLDNQSGVNTGDETTSSIQSKRPLKTVEGQSLEGSGNIDLDKSDVGLNNVDNTSDLNKPISTATQSELNGLEGRLDSEEEAVRSTTAADQTLTDGQFTILDYDTAVFNNATSNFTIGTDGRITVNTTGIYDISAGVVVRSGLVSASQATALGIFVNGNLISIDANENPLALNSQRAHTLSTQINLTSGDIVDARAFTQSTGGGVLDFLALLLPVLFGVNATQVNHLAVVKCNSR